MRRRDIARMLATTVLLGASACGYLEEAPTGPQMPVHRLADELAHAGGARVASASTVGDVTRYLMSGVTIGELFPPGTMRSDEQGTAEIVVECPPELAGRSVVAKVATLTSELHDRDWTLRAPISCPAGDARKVPLLLRDLEPNIELWATVVGHASPAPHVKSQWVTLDSDASLRLAMGIAYPGPPAEAPPVRFTLHVESRDGRTVTLLERTLDPGRRPEDGQWVELRTGLDRLRRRLGSEVRFVFETTLADARRGPDLGVWGDPTLYVPRPAGGPEVPRNVVLISIDTLRADRLHSYGFPMPTSPNLDRLAAQGALFETTVAQANWTLPSHEVMLTGVYACAHRLTGGGFHAMPPGIEPIAETLRRQGYTTTAFTEDGYVDPAVFQRGFGLFRANHVRGPGGPAGSVEDTVASARHWLEGHSDVPFFLFVHTYQVHAPYEPPPEYRERFANAPAPVADGFGPPDPALVADAAAYAGEVAYTDAVIGGFLDFLSERGLDGRTIVVVTSDHGEAFGEHGHRFHGTALFEEEVRVPLIWRAPGLVPAGRRLATIAGLVDIVPTLLDLLGLPIPPWMHGTSLLALMLNGDGAVPGARERVVFAENPLLGHVAVRGRQWKAFLGGLFPKVYLLDVDPHEEDPRSDVALMAMANLRGQRFDQDCKRVRQAVAADAPAEPTSVDPDRDRKLRALGYVE